MVLRPDRLLDHPGSLLGMEMRVSDPVPLKYCAFLSYSHRDKAWGKWLHAALEGYRIDKDLVGRVTPIGPVPRTLRPIFRDREFAVNLI